MAFEGLLPSGLIYRSRWQARNASSVLSLLRRLLDAHPDRERLAGAAVTRPTQGRCAQVIEPDSDPHMGVGGAKSVGRIESDPAELRDEGFRPGVAGLLLVHAVVAAEIAAEIARGNTEAARGRDEDVGEVPTCAALERKGLGGRGCRARGSGIVGHILMQPREHEMQEVEHIATGGVAARGGETGNIRIGSGECGRAQIEARWEPLNHAAHYPLGITGLDLALDRHGKLAEWPLGGEHMGDVAEGIFVLVEPAIRGDVDAPARHVLAVMVAWGQPQHLDHAGSGRLVAVTGQMRDADTHERRQPVCKGRTYRTACARPSRVCYSAVLKPIALPISDIAR